MYIANEAIVWSKSHSITTCTIHARKFRCLCFTGIQLPLWQLFNMEMIRCSPHLTFSVYINVLLTLWQESIQTRKRWHDRFDCWSWRKYCLPFEPLKWILMQQNHSSYWLASTGTIPQIGCQRFSNKLFTKPHWNRKKIVSFRNEICNSQMNLITTIFHFELISFWFGCILMIMWRKKCPV